MKVTLIKSSNWCTNETPTFIFWSVSSGKYYDKNGIAILSVTSYKHKYFGKKNSETGEKTRRYTSTIFLYFTR